MAEASIDNSMPSGYDTPQTKAKTKASRMHSHQKEQAVSG